MTRKELIEIGKKIIASEGTAQEIDNLFVLFNNNVPHPEGANLFFYPENYNRRRDSIADYKPSIEEVVDKCLSYKPIVL